MPLTQDDESDASALRLLDEVLQAFPHKNALQDDDLILIDGFDPEAADLLNALRGLDWTIVGFRALRAAQSATNFLEPRGWCHFLPAFLGSSLLGECDDLVDRTLTTLSPTHGRIAVLQPLLTGRQQDVTAAVVRYLLDRHGYTEDDPEFVDSLLRAWPERSPAVNSEGDPRAEEPPGINSREKLSH